ncbi:MAG TPA: orotidine-5'-phosphate decarboxylase [bacterium]|nr:orotidine-5'-phosphate decarboxylase [bacterium]
MAPLEPFSKRLQAAVSRTGGCLCVGLDVDLAKMPKDIPADGPGALRFCRAIIEATRPYAAAYKANLAFFESLGTRGFEVLELLRRSIPPDALFIADAKRGDIGNTSQAYAQALYGNLRSDSVTLSPYMGKDSVEPFLKYPGTCSFVLCLTSNPSAADFQLQALEGGEKLYERVARTAPGWAKGQSGEVGLVVGATKAEYVKSLRVLAPEAAFLVPGVGAQGGDLKAVLEAGRAKDGAGILVNASRSILYASAGPDYAEAAAAEAAKMVGQMKAYF